jgi:mersacidin/lichenicidin family type 2 lantibiotic
MEMRREKGTKHMKIDIIRAWKDEEYRNSLSSEEQAMLPANPAGALELSDADLEGIHGAGGDHVNTNAAICLQSVLIFCLTINGNCGNA